MAEQRGVRKINPVPSWASRTGMRYRGIVSALPGKLLLGGKRTVTSSWFAEKSDAKRWAEAMSEQTNAGTYRIEVGRGRIDIGQGGSWVRGNPIDSIGKKLTRVRVRRNGKVFPAFAKKVNGRVRIFVEPKVARRVNQGSIRKWTMAAIRSANAEAGLYFFDRSALRAFDSKILPAVYQGNGGVYFITSEQFHGSTESHPRMFTVRKFDPSTAQITSPEGFNKIRFVDDARDLARRLARG